MRGFNTPGGLAAQQLLMTKRGKDATEEVAAKCSERLSARLLGPGGAVNAVKVDMCFVVINRVVSKEGDALFLRGANASGGLAGTELFKNKRGKDILEEVAAEVSKRPAALGLDPWGAVRRVALNRSGFEVINRETSNEGDALILRGYYASGGLADRQLFKNKRGRHAPEEGAAEISKRPVAMWLDPCGAIGPVTLSMSFVVTNKVASHEGNALIMRGSNTSGGLADRQLCKNKRGKHAPEEVAAEVSKRPAALGLDPCGAESGRASCRVSV